MGIYRVIDAKKQNATGLLAVSTGAAAAVSAIPGSVGDPIADKLMDLSSFFLFILTVILVEKYVLAILGTIVFGVLIPASCAVVGLKMFTQREGLKQIGYVIFKITAIALALLMAIYIAVGVANAIDGTYQKTLQATIDSSNEVDSVSEETDEGEKQGFLSRVGGAISGAWNSVVDGVSGAFDKAKNTLNRLLEAAAVMLVTTCLIPLLPVIVGALLVKKLWGIDLTGGRLGRLIGPGFPAGRADAGRE